MGAKTRGPSRRHGDLEIAPLQLGWSQACSLARPSLARHMHLARIHPTLNCPFSFSNSPSRPQFGSAALLCL